MSNTWILDQSSSFSALYSCIILRPRVPGNINTNCFWTMIDGNTFRPYSGPAAGPYACVLSEGANNAILIKRNAFSNNARYGIKQATDSGEVGNSIIIADNWFEGAMTSISLDGDPGHYWCDGVIVNNNRVELSGPNTVFLEMNRTASGTVLDQQQPPILFGNIVIGTKNYVLNAAGARVQILDLAYYGPVDGRSQIVHGDETLYLAGNLAVGNQSGNSAWDQGHIDFGGWHLWPDGLASLRWKNGAPTSSVDGGLIQPNAVPRTVTSATDTIRDNDTSIIFNTSATCTETLPSASAVPGRLLYLKTIAAQSVISASANVVSLAGGAPGAAVLTSVVGKFALLQSDGTNWQTIMAN